MFEIKEKFYLNGEPFQIISGAVHYFRIMPEYRQDRLEKLVNMGCNIYTMDFSRTEVTVK